MGLDELMEANAALDIQYEEEEKAMKKGGKR